MILLVLLAILIVLILLVCGDKGSRSILTTAMNAVLLLGAIYLIYRGLAPVAVTFCACVIISLITLFFQNEINLKSKVSFCSVVLVIALLLPLVFLLAGWANAEAFPPEQYELTDSNGYTRNIGIDMLSLQISVMIIALLGTVIDTAVAITASVTEIHANNQTLSMERLLEASFTVSKAVLATSIHTIFYIYIAEFLTLFIQYLSDYSLITVLNSASLSRELITISVSGLGCCLVVPVTTVLAAWAIHRQKK
jgi:uncharacterized membrane protein